MRWAAAGSVPSVRREAAGSVRAAVAAMGTLEHSVEVGSVRPVHSAEVGSVPLVHRAAAVTVPLVHRAAAVTVPLVHSAAAVMVQPVRAVHRAVAAMEPAAWVPEPGQ